MSTNPNTPQNTGKQNAPSGMPRKMNFINIILIVVLAFLLIIGIYSQVASTDVASTPVSISTLAADVGKGLVTSLKINGDQIVAQYADKSTKTTQKESDSSLTESLLRFGVSQKQLASTTIMVNEPSGFGYWLGQLAPFLAPILFLVFFIWLLSRQVKGAGVQALSFGQSKARITMPDDKALALFRVEAEAHWDRCKGQRKD
jgi:ATP-dependent Zn protease